MVWVSRVLAAVLVMVLPGWLGQRMDLWLGTSYLTLIGLGIGLTLAMVYLLLVTRPPERSKDGQKNANTDRTT
jgi:hypothetical protein